MTAPSGTTSPPMLDYGTASPPPPPRTGRDIALVTGGRVALLGAWLLSGQRILCRLHDRRRRLAARPLGRRRWADRAAPARHDHRDRAIRGCPVLRVRRGDRVAAARRAPAGASAAPAHGRHPA